MIVSIDVDTQKTFTPLCPKELPAIEGHLTADGLDAQAALTDLHVMTKDAHHVAAKWLVDNPVDMLKPTGSPDADLTWVSHAMAGIYGYELLDGLPSTKEYDYCVWKGVDPELHPYGTCSHDIEEELSTGLIEWLRYQNADTVVIGGLVTDYCVETAVLQLPKGGAWKVIVNQTAYRGIAPETVESAWREMYSAGAIILENVEEIKKYISNQ